MAYNEDSYHDIYYNESRTQGERKRKKKKKRKKHFGLIFFLFLLIALFVAAAVTNPTENESRQIVKNRVLEFAEGYVEKKLADYDNPWLQAGAAAGLKLAPKIWDKAVKTEVKDYGFFTTFRADIEIKGYSKNLLSGIIVFGQMIPLSSELKNMKLTDELQNLMQHPN